MFNPYIIVPLATWVIAQLTKFTIEAFRGKLDFRNLYATGGMPSVHSAVVASLATTSGLLDGASSHLFGLTLVIAVIVIYDSLNVRRSTGDQAVALNLVIDNLNAGRGSQPMARLREVLGHTPAEVTVGTLMGVVLGGLFNYTRLDWLSNFLGATPRRPELFIYLGISVAMLLISIVLRVALRRRARRLTSWGKLLRNLLAVSVAAAVLEGLFTFGALENASFLTWRAWTLVTIVLALLLAAWASVRNTRRMPAEAMAAAEIERKQKWLKPKKRRR